ncbi:15816_t:CDS:10 [Rhizophagus irregularis]|nr:15816_t:CDS:10 [Rhizophagus irregularis]
MEVVNNPSKRRGIAPVKAEFIINKQNIQENCESVFGDEEAGDNSKNKEPSKKKSRVTRKRGRNKEQAKNTFAEPIRLCHKISLGEQCDNEFCKFSHDLQAYLKVKGEDLSDRCPNFEKFGKCRFGYRCRYLKAHLSPDDKLIVNEELASSGIFVEEKNNQSTQVQKRLRTHSYKFPKADTYLAEMQQEIEKQKELEKANRLAKSNPDNKLNKPSEESNVDSGTNVELSERLDTNEVKVNDLNEDITLKVEEESDKSFGSDTESTNTKKRIKYENGDFENKEKVKLEEEIELKSRDDVNVEEFIDTPDVPLRTREKKKMTFKNKLYLAPLTTVGNLPFRRICKEFGADITCGEMAMATNLLQGQQSEWALLKRHISEDCFGVQICGAKAEHLVKCAEMLNNEIEADFIDVNLGCPIDLVFNKGGGSKLLMHDGRLGKILKGMNKVMDIPVTLHGRSRQQRYTKLADWKYITEVSSKTNGMSYFGNGDVLGYEDYYHHIENDHVDGVMIGRGALGINQTRRFLCEWMILPQRINERPPAFRGRDDLETLMASPNSKDWVKISEMLLGPAPDSFVFVPKHASNSYEG